MNSVKSLVSLPVELIIYLITSRIGSRLASIGFIAIGWILGFFLLKIIGTTSYRAWVFPWFNRVARHNPIWYRTFANMIRAGRTIRDLRRKGTLIPAHLAFFIVSECNRACASCPKIARPNMADEVWIRLARRAVEDGVLAIDILGGEPMLRKDLIVKIKQAVGDKIILFVFTNGDLVSEKDIVEFNELGIVLVFNIGSKQKDDTKAFSAMKLAKEHHALIAVGITVTQENYLQVTSEEYLKMLMDDYGVSLGIHFHYSPVGNCEVDQKCNLTEDAYWAVEERLRENRLPMRLFHYSRCHTLRSIVFVEAGGQVSICPFSRGKKSLGNVKVQSISEIINSPEAAFWRDLNQDRHCLMSNHSDELLKAGFITGDQHNDLKQINWPRNYIRPLPWSAARLFIRQFIWRIPPDKKAG